MNRLDIIIVNWNSGDQLKEAVQSICQYHQGWVSSVIILDNASSDRSLNAVESLQNLPFRLRIVKNSANLGFAAACNQGAQSASSDYILFLNPDARLFENSLPVTMAFMNQPAHQSIGICGIKLIDEAGEVSRHCVRFPSALSFAAASLGLDKLIRPLGYFMNEWDHLNTRQVDHVIGAFYLVRRKAFEELQGFDERFFIYLEDLDFSLRARQKGWLSLYLAEASAFHAGGGTSRQIKAQRLFYALRSRIIYAFKHFSKPSAWGVLACSLIVEPITRLAFASIKRSWPDIKYTLDGYRLLLGQMPSILSKLDPS